MLRTPRAFHVLAPLLLVAVQSLAPASATTTKPGVRFDGCALPLWPQLSLRAGHSGVVTLSYLVAENGRVRESRIKQSSGYPALDLAAQEGIERCAFTPGTENGKPVTAWMDMQYVWRIEGDDPAVEAERMQNLIKAAESGDADSQYKLGLAYIIGGSVPQDKGHGQQWIAKAAEQGLADAQAALGALELGRSTPGTRSEAAMAWFRKAAEQGDGPSLFIVGGDLMREGKVDEAFEKLRMSAEKGFPAAQEIAGELLLESEDVNDQLEGYELLRKAADKHMPGALFKLAQCHAEGKVVVRDDVQAAKLYSEAAANGSVEAKIALAGFYETGRGVNKNLERARRLQQEAEEAGKAETAQTKP